MSSDSEGGSSKGSKSDMSYSSKGSKSGDGSSKGSKSGDGSSKGSKGCYNVCSKGSKGSDGSSKGSKSDMSYSGKGGKSGDGSGKSGKSGDMSYSSKGSKSGCDGSSKGSKSGDGSSKGSKSGAPSTCADCDCGEDDRQWLFVGDLGACVFTECGGSCSDFDAMTCFQYGSQAQCCDDEFLNGSCKVLDVCSPGSSSKSGKSSTSKASKSSPTPAPVENGGSLTPRPTPSEIDFRTPEPTPGGTTTVATGASGEPTLPPRPTP